MITQLDSTRVFTAKHKKTLLANLVDNLDFTDQAGIIGNTSNLLTRCKLLQFVYTFLGDPDFVFLNGFSEKQIKSGERADFEERYKGSVRSHAATAAAEALSVSPEAFADPSKLTPEMQHAFDAAANEINAHRVNCYLFSPYGLALTAIHNHNLRSKKSPEARPVKYRVDLRQAAVSYFFAMNSQMNPFAAIREGETICELDEDTSKRIVELYEEMCAFYFSHEEINTTNQLLKEFAESHRADKGKTQGATHHATQQQPEWTRTYQGNAVHALMKSANVETDYTQDRISQTLKRNVDGIDIILDGDLSSISGQTLKVLIILLEIFTSQIPGKKSPLSQMDINIGRHIKLSLKDYMKKCELTDITSAKAQLLSSIEELYHISLDWSEPAWEKPDEKKRSEKILKHHRLRITDHTITDDDLSFEHGAIDFAFSYDLTVYLSGAYIMPVPSKLFTINTRLHPYSVQFGWKLSAHRNMNDGKKTQDIIAVLTLMKSALSLPAYEDIARTGQIIQRIVKPFERDLAELLHKGILARYWYIKPDGTHIEGGQGEHSPLFALSFHEFMQLKVFFVFKDYPPMDEVREKKQARLTTTSHARKAKTKSKKAASQA